MSSMPDISALPVDLWLSIFRKSEPKTLGICKCVCKHWRDIISSPYFINYRLNLAKSSPPSSSSENLQGRSQDAIRAFPFSREEFRHFHGVVDVGVSGGIYCFWVLMKEEEEEEKRYSKCRITLWNPAIRTCMVLCTIDFDRLYNVLGTGFFMLLDGFGFEPVSNDYKYVMISGYMSKPRHSPSTAHVYSIARGSWRSFPLIIPPHLRVAGSGARGACVDGVVYWKIFVQGFDQADDDYRCGQAMLTFDVRDEVFGVMELPEEEIKELEQDLYKGRGMFEGSSVYNMESLVLWDKQAKPTPWSRGVSVVEAQDLDLESSYYVSE